ncbi:hypothetical protein FDECE_8547 [Fusarium decemcellulare]|nr:hypothetical protein FDECE_8547 [Fusarium decemcellulare]
MISVLPTASRHTRIFACIKTKTCRRSSRLFDGNSPTPGTDSGPGAEARDNINAHCKSVLVTFDNRNEGILEPENSLLRGTPSDLQAALGKLREDEGGSAMPKVIKQIDGPVVGVEHANHLTKGDVNGGFTLLYHMTRRDPDMLAPTDRVAQLRWMAAERPVMVRTLDLLYCYFIEQRKRVLLYVDVPWIQC